MSLEDDLICREDYDFKLIPPEYASEQDELEIRLQFRTGASGSPGDLDIAFYWDEIREDALFHRTRGRAGADWTLVRTRLPLAGRAGDHHVIARLSWNGRHADLKNIVRVSPRPETVLRGGFVMIGPPNGQKEGDSFRTAVKNLTDEQWKMQIDAWNAMGMKTIITISSYQPLDIDQGNLHAHYPSRILPKTPDLAAEDPIAAILQAAEKNGQKVFLGLGHHGRFSRFEDIMVELFERYSRYRSFYGWYASYEFCTAAANFEGAGRYWKTIGERRNRLSPVMPILISPYQHGLDLDPDPELVFTDNKGFILWQLCGPNPAFRKFLLDHPGCVDIMMPQDGVGRRHPLDRGPDQIGRNHRMFAANREICREAGIHLWANVESFDIDDRGQLLPRYAGGGFDGEDGFVQQMEAVAPFCEQLLTFCLSGFFAAPGVQPELGGPAAVRQARDYLNYLKKPSRPYENIALGKQYECVPAPTDMLADNPDRGKLTDGMLSGGMAYAVDNDRLIGYYSGQADEQGNLQVTVTADLDAPETFTRIRLGGAVRRIPGRADRMTVAVSNDRRSWKILGTADCYRHGWIGLELPEPVSARYVRLRLEKHFHTDVNHTFQDSWLFLDELEISRPL